MAAVKDQRKYWLVLLLYVYEVCLFDSVQAVASDTESRIVERVSRRQNTDIYFFINSSTACGDKNTYLISEDQCVFDQELFRGCSHFLTPSQQLHLTAIAVFDPSSSNITMSSITYIEMFKFNETNQAVNSSLCHISSLEVYRGREQAIEISHQGFSLIYNGSIQITTDELGYDLEDYIGEFYRMNLSCSGGELPESGCLFFKVTATGQKGQNFGYVTNAKFNCTVPGTLYDFIEECNITTTATTLTPETMTDSTVPTSYTTTLKPDDINEPTIITVTVVYVLSGLGGGILILTISVITMCTYYCLRLAKRKRQELMFTAVPPHNVYTMEDDHEQQPHGNELPRPMVLSESVIVSEDTEHVYAVLEQTQLHPTNVGQLNETTKQARQTRLLETVPTNGFQYVTNQTGLKSRSATWTSAQQSMVRPKPRHENLELVQIYDKVMIDTEGRTATADTDNEPSYPGNYRKHSLPANIGEHQHSMANTSHDCPVSNGSDEKTDDSIPIYSQPDMSKKREERRKKRKQKEREERVAAMEKLSSSSSPCAPLLQLDREEMSITEMTASDAVVDGQQQIDTDLKFEKHFDKQNNNSDDKVPVGKDECLYDEPLSLNFACKSITQRKEKEEDVEENFEGRKGLA